MEVLETGSQATVEIETSPAVSVQHAATTNKISTVWYFD